MDEYKSGNEEDRSASDDDKQISCDEEAVAETIDIKKDDVQSELADIYESFPLGNVEIPSVKIEKLEIEPMEPMEDLLKQDDPLLPVVKTEPADTEVPFEEVTSSPIVHTELAVEMSLSTSVKMESIDVAGSDSLQITTFQEVVSSSYEHSETDFTSEEINKICTDDEVNNDSKLLDSLDLINDNANLLVGLDEGNDNNNLLEAIDEGSTSAQRPIETTEVTEALEDASSSILSASQTDEGVESRNQLTKEETVTILDPLIAITQTPTVNSSLDGNIEMTNKQPAPAPPAGIKIKINLFNKASSTIASTAQQFAPPLPSQPDAGLTSCPANVPENSSKLLVPTSDENALTNKPRLAGRKLTVLPLMTKGVETSGLCSIM
jgi:hypothetical protein